MYALSPLYPKGRGRLGFVLVAKFYATHYLLFSAQLWPKHRAIRILHSAIFDVNCGKKLAHQFSKD